MECLSFPLLIGRPRVRLSAFRAYDYKMNRMTRIEVVGSINNTRIGAVLYEYSSPLYDTRDSLS